MKAYLPYIFALGTALCWGLYGHAIAKANHIDDSSAFKPYVGIGLAYLLIAIGGGIIAMFIMKDSFNFNEGVTKWGFISGVLGALGALSLTLAMYFGGKFHPETVMPVVFGGAVSVAAIFRVYTNYTSGGQLEGNALMWMGIVGIGLCAMVVAFKTPKPVKPSHAPVHAAADAVPASETAPSKQST